MKLFGKIRQNLAVHYWRYAAVWLVLAALLSGWLAYRAEHARARNQVLANLRLNHELSRSAVQGELQALAEELPLLAEEEAVKELLHRGGPASAGFERWARALVGHFGYYDLFVIDREGQVIYSVTREEDLGTSLQHGPFAASGLGRLYRKVLAEEGFATVDFSVYRPSHNQLAGFLGTPIFDGNRLIGILALQLPTSFFELNIGLHMPGIEDYILTGSYAFKSDGSFVMRDSLVVPGGEEGMQVRNDTLFLITPLQLSGLSWQIMSVVPPAVTSQLINGPSVVYPVLISMLVISLILLPGWRFLARPVVGASLAASDILLVQNTWQQFARQAHGLGADLILRLKNKAGIVVGNGGDSLAASGRAVEQQVDELIRSLADEERLQALLMSLAQRATAEGINPRKLRRLPYLLVESLEDESQQALPARARKAWLRVWQALTERARLLIR